MGSLDASDGMHKFRIIQIAWIFSFLCIVTLCIYNLNQNIRMTLDDFYQEQSQHHNRCAQCTSYKPCAYKDEVDIRIIVITYRRVSSLRKCLGALQNADMMGANAAMEIWIDVSKTGKVHERLLALALAFRWRYGPVCVHVQTNHCNVAFQWIYSWQPKSETKEIGLFIEDDVDVSRYFYRYLRHAWDFYASYKDMSGICLTDENCQIAKGPSAGKPLKRPTGKSDIVFLYGIFCTWGYAPYPHHWRAFQDWYHKNVSKNHHFDPTDKDIELQSAWYRGYKKLGKTDTMLHEIYLIKYYHDHKLYTLHPNLQVKVKMQPHSGLTTNRQVKGLHNSGRSKYLNHSLITWKDDFVNFPILPKKYNLDGSLLE